MTSTSKPSFSPSSCMVSQVAGVAAAEPGVVADHHVAGVEAVHQDLADEFLGGQAGQVQRVLHDQHGVEAQLAQGHQLVLQAHDHLGRGLRAVDLRRMRVEGDGDGFGAVQAGDADELRRAPAGGRGARRRSCRK